jgi:membrane fusion protein (multidrug efflux system)
MTTAPALRAIPATPAEPLLETPAPVAKAPPEAKAPAQPHRKGFVRKTLFAAVAIAALSAGAWYGHEWYTVGRFAISTDDAFVKTDMSSLGAKVAGYVASVPLPDNTPVKAGQLLLTLDDGDYRLAVEAAKAKIETQKATIDRIGRQVEAQQAAIDSAAAQVSMAESQAANSAMVLQRQKRLVSQNAASQQVLDDATAKASWNDGAVAQAKAAVVAAKAQADVLSAQAAEAKATLAELQTALNRATRDLSFTEIRAPFDGIVANRAVEAGQYVEPGQKLMSLVPANAGYVEANFKETQIAGLVPGQTAKVSVDAFGGETVDGKVESVSPASGAEFSLLPPENATGNFTKVTQRVPVRIALPAEVMAKLRPGLSVTVSVDTRETGGTRLSLLQ